MRIEIGSERLLTSDAIAQAVIEYVLALARTDSSATVTIPIVTDDDTVQDVWLVLAPARGIALLPTLGDDVPMQDAETVATLRYLTSLVERRDPKREPASHREQAPGDDRFTTAEWLKVAEESKSSPTLGNLDV